MAIYYMNVKIGGGGKSAVAAAAYRAGDKLKDEQSGKTYHYDKPEVLYSEIILPEHAPDAWKDREVLWNHVMEISKRKDAQTFREFVTAIPNELDEKEAITLARAYGNHLRKQGMCVDFSIHWKPGNHHIHYMATTRPVTEKGEFGPKEKTEFMLDESGSRIPILDKKTGKQKVDKHGRKAWKRHTVGKAWDDKAFVPAWRKSWEQCTNRALEEHEKATGEHVEPVDCRSYKEQGLDRVPTRHEGGKIRRLEKAGIHTEIADFNRQARAYNRDMEEVEREEAQLYRQIQNPVYRALSAHEELIKIQLHVYRHYKNPESDPDSPQALKNAYRIFIGAEQQFRPLYLSHRGRRKEDRFLDELHAQQRRFNSLIKSLARAGLKAPWESYKAFAGPADKKQADPETYKRHLSTLVTMETQGEPLLEAGMKLKEKQLGKDYSTAQKRCKAALAAVPDDVLDVAPLLAYQRNAILDRQTDAWTAATALDSGDFRSVWDAVTKPIQNRYEAFRARRKAQAARQESRKKMQAEIFGNSNPAALPPLDRAITAVAYIINDNTALTRRQRASALQALDRARTTPAAASELRKLDCLDSDAVHTLAGKYIAAGFLDAPGEHTARTRGDDDLSRD